MTLPTLTSFNQFIDDILKNISKGDDPFYARRLVLKLRENHLLSQNDTQNSYDLHQTNTMFAIIQNKVKRIKNLSLRCLYAMRWNLFLDIFITSLNDTEIGQFSDVVKESYILDIQPNPNFPLITELEEMGYNDKEQLSLKSNGICSSSYNQLNFSTFKQSASTSRMTQKTLGGSAAPSVFK